MTKRTTVLNTLFDKSSQQIITGKEKHPVYSMDERPVLTDEIVSKLFKLFAEKEYNRYYSCIEKAITVANFLGLDEICLGSLVVDSMEEGASYGFYYNPPLELHAWVFYQNQIIDLALAGVIENGLQIKDEIGYILIGREPVVLAGYPDYWMHYKLYKTVKTSEVKLMDKEVGKKLLKYYKIL